MNTRIAGWKGLGFAALALLLAGLALAAEEAGDSHQAHARNPGHDGHQMQFDRQGMVMNSNSTELPLNCQQLTEDVHFTVYAGTAHAFSAGQVFGYSQHEFSVSPCSRVTVHLVNEDQVRHQWMLHGLPRYLYPQGMFHLEAAGGQTVMGSFIVPADAATYLVHCDITQHMEKGMKAQLLVGKGNGNLWSIPGVSENFLADQEQLPDRWLLWLAMAGILLLAVSLARWRVLQRLLQTEK
ncbi:MAG: multicopper oxidase domain-containing protein [Pseudomonadales bacterium]|nr:multicopper oxidase domain-containing protein [Pseudomonadales bacterium]